MTETLARPDRADDARHDYFMTHDRTTDDSATGFAPAGSTTVDVMANEATEAAWDAWAARVDGERDIAMVLDALPRAHALTGMHATRPLHPLAPVDGVLALPGGVVGPFTGLGRPGRRGPDRGFVRLTGRRRPTGWSRLRLALLVAVALWCASNATTLVVAVTDR
ncbi:MAG: hypothetical protein ACRCYR_10545 [Phycicoccus sp.]